MKSRQITESEKLIRRTIREKNIFPPDIASQLNPVKVISVDDFSKRMWIKTPIEECGDPIVRLDNTDKLVTHSLYRHQDHEAISPVDDKITRIPGALEHVYVRKRLAEVLNQASMLLPDDYQLLVLDGFRPHIIQKTIYEMMKKTLGKNAGQYVLPPDEFASHATGGAADLTLLKRGKPIDLGVRIDEIKGCTHLHSFEEANTPERKIIRDNRRFLQWLLKAPSIMEEGVSNVVGIPTEPWHFELTETQLGAFTVNKNKALCGNAENTNLLPPDLL